jgi:hypothetical protein
VKVKVVAANWSRAGSLGTVGDPHHAADDDEMIVARSRQTARFAVSDGRADLTDGTTRRSPSPWILKSWRAGIAPNRKNAKWTKVCANGRSNGPLTGPKFRRNPVFEAEVDQNAWR